MVERRFDETDRRRSILSLSETGLAIYDEIAPLAMKLEASLLENFEPGERELLMRLLDKLDAAEMRAHI